MRPCGACKWSRRRCEPDCIFAPHFPSDDPQKFAVVHKGLPVDQRGRAVSSLVYEADVRVRDPVNGCVGEISSLKNQVSELQKKLAGAQAQNAEKGKEPFETAQEKEPSVFAAARERINEAAEKRIPKFPFDLNEITSDED
ncbi:hypothetical protein QN277_004522 [Acacia crassicarpa]|uniref:LOB domain-containing protein n=1 Tax=Acacia crassicarpa TaxID=499986 RepID=A0AAE1J0J7_9FABA|nr:hypothetical protein QN277_004522 [Acacia crassicarpa]